MNKGFTLIEILIVLAVTVLISSYVISYSKVGQNQVALEIETQKIANLILAAKAAAVATLDTPERQSARTAQGRIICGYGFEITYSDPASYRIFSYEPQAATCTNINPIRPQDRFSIPSGLLPSPSAVVSANVLLNEKPCSVTPCDALHVVLFVPPNPETLLSRNGKGALPPTRERDLRVYLETADGSAKKIITVTQSGQVDF
ncbi:MAG: prepilin-type N-terminal cleavage/methylation domain-containing protein [Patescibacteria group bacterium]